MMRGITFTSKKRLHAIIGALHIDKENVLSSYGVEHISDLKEYQAKDLINKLQKDEPPEEQWRRRAYAAVQKYLKGQVKNWAEMTKERQNAYIYDLALKASKRPAKPPLGGGARQAWKALSVNELQRVYYTFKKKV